MTILKGKTSMFELMQMPFKFFHTLYHSAWVQGNSEEGKEKIESEHMEEAMEEMMSGGF